MGQEKEILNLVSIGVPLSLSVPLISNHPPPIKHFDCLEHKGVKCILPASDRRA